MTPNGTTPKRRPDERQTPATQAEAFSKLYARPLPYSLEAEMSLLGSIILDPRALDLIQPILTAGEASFYDEGHAAIYLAVVDSYDKVPGADLNTIIEVLRDRGQEKSVGGADYLVKLVSETPSSAGAQRYARIVADKHLCRQIIDACDATIHETLNASSLEDAAELLDHAESRIMGLAQSRVTASNAPSSLADLLDQELARMRDSEGAGQHGLMTGFYDLDKLLAGLHPGEMVVLAARPSMGKTALMLNIAEQVAASGAAGVFSLEMSKVALVQRLISAFSQVDSHKVRTKTMTRLELDSIEAGAERLGALPIFIDDSSNLNLLTLRAAARRMVSQHGAKVILIDYLQLLTAPGNNRENRQVEVSAISRGIKSLAKELNVPVVVLSQLNRASENRQGNRPRMSDLRESGSIEQDADVVLLLHREDYYHRDDQAWRDANPDRINTAELIVEKQRNGPTGVVWLTWDPRTTRFRNHSSLAAGGGYSATSAQGSLIDSDERGPW